MKKSNGSRAYPRPRYDRPVGRCKVASFRAAPKLFNVPSALSGRALSDALLMAKHACMR